MAKSVSFSGYMAVGKEEANRILQDHLSEDGKFLVRPSDSGNALYTVSVVRKQRILKYPVNQEPSDLHYRVSNYPDRFPHLEQLVQHYRHTSISSKETVLLREPVNGWPKSKGEYGVFVRPNSGSNDRKHPGSVRNGPLPPIPGSADPVSNSGHKLDRQPSLISSAKSVGSANRAEQPMLKPQSPHLGRLARAESQRESRPDLWQETPQDCRRDTQLDSHQGARHSLRQNHMHASRPESQPDPRHNLQRGSSSLSVNVGCYIHPNIAHEDVQRVFAPYLAKNGSYLIRPSATAGKMTLCVTHNGTIVNFRISRNEKTRLYQITSKKSFESLEELLEAYHTHPIKSKEKKVEIFLAEGIPTVEGSGSSDDSLTSPTSPADQSLPAPWVKYYSEEHKKYYYHNSATNVTQWEPPLPRTKKNRPLPSLPGDAEKPVVTRQRLMSLPSTDRHTMRNRPLPSIPDAIKDSSPPPLPQRGAHPSAFHSQQDVAPQHNGMPTVNHHAGRSIPAREEKAERGRKGGPPALPPKVAASEENSAPPPLPAALPHKQKRAPPPLPEKESPDPSIPSLNGGPPPRPEKTREDVFDKPSRRVPQVPVGAPPSVPIGGPPSVPVGGPPSVPVGGPPSVPVGGPPSVPVDIPHSAPMAIPPSVQVTGSPSTPGGGAPPPPPPPPPPPIVPPSHHTLPLPSSDQLSRSAPSTPAQGVVGRRNTVTPAELMKGMTTLKRTERQEPAHKRALDGMGGILSRKLDEMRSFVKEDSDSDIEEVESDDEWS